MFTIKSLKNGQNAVYVQNNEAGRSVIRALLIKNREDYLDATGNTPSFRIVPLSYGKIAIYFRNDKRGQTLVDSLLAAHAESVASEEDRDEDGPADFDFENLELFPLRAH